MDADFHLLNLIERARELVKRLERISADSCWAHSSSGVRGSLWKLIDRYEKHQRGKAFFRGEDIELLEAQVDEGFRMLVEAAREIPGDIKK